MAVVLGPNASVLLSDYNITSVDVYEDTGLSVVIPAGNPEATILLDARGIIGPNVGAVGGSWITVKLVVEDGGDPYDVPNSERLLVFVDQDSVTGQNFQAQATFTFPVELTDTTLTTTVKVFAILKGVSAGYSLARVASNSDGTTVLSWTL